MKFVPRSAYYAYLEKIKFFPVHAIKTYVITPPIIQRLQTGSPLPSSTTLAKKPQLPIQYEVEWAPKTGWTV